MREWLHNIQGGPYHQHFDDTAAKNRDLNVRLMAAMAITKTLIEFHNEGVVYNMLSLDNILLDSFEGGYVASFIDLSRASIAMKQKPKQGKTKSTSTSVGGGGGTTYSDLQSLGFTLNQLFRREDSALSFGEPSHLPNTEGTHPENRQRKRGKQHLIGEGLPLYLSSLITALQLSGDDTISSCELYTAAKDVYHDLKVFAETSKDSLRRWEPDASTMESRLQLKNDLFYGRGVQLSIIMHLIQSMFLPGSTPLMATISGYPGTGKSSLVDQIQKPLKERGGNFIAGKFDKDAHPDAVLASALNSFFGQIMLATGAEHVAMRWRIHDALGSSGITALIATIPNLCLMMGESSNDDDQGSVSKNAGVSHRLKFLLCKVVAAIPTKSHPLVLYLDDLQWSDDTTLDVILMLVTDPDVHHFLFLGTYRENEVNLSHPLTTRLNAIQEQGVSIVTVKVGPIEKECVNDLVSEALCLPPNLCNELAAVIHSKTGGCILFIVKFLKSLNDEELMWFSMSTRRWEYNLNAIGLKEVPDDVVQHLSHMMNRLSKNTQLGLKFAACLGPNFGKDLLELTKKGGEFDTDSFLKSCAEDGFFVEDEDSSTYTWCHDEIHQAGKKRCLAQCIHDQRFRSNFRDYICLVHQLLISFQHLSEMHLGF